MPDAFKKAIALGALALMALMMFTSVRDDSIIIDEDPHIGAGYSYLVAGDFRINPEHPPLMKDLGALPLLWMNLKEPWDHKSWTTDINGQWEFGRALIFGSGNDADAITQAVKVPMMLFTLALGLLAFLWVRGRYGLTTATIVTVLYAFSPTFLAHGRFVTTDVGAAAGFFVAVITFLQFLERPNGANIFWAGLGLGFAFLVKFSTFMLVPIYVIVALLWTLVSRRVSDVAFTAPTMTSHMPFAPHEDKTDTRIADRELPVVPFWGIMFKTVLVIFIAYLSIYPLYWHHTRNYPPERQKADTTQILETFSIGAMRAAADVMQEKNILAAHSDRVRNFPQNLVIWASDKPVWKPFAEYFLGLLMVFQRSAGGNTSYFLGEVHKYGSPWYFPVVYALKEPLTMHALALAALLYGIATLFRRPPNRREWLFRHFTEVVLLIVVAFYWWASMRSILNIGVRHLLPTFLPIYILAAVGVVRLGVWLSQWKPIKAAATVVLVALLGWQVVSVASVHPSYLAYFNEIAGGAEGGAEYVVDSNLDWGQDLKRLSQFVEERGIQEIAVDYFGWADVNYYLKGKEQRLSSCDDPRLGWVAVSASFYQGSRELAHCDYRRWLTPERFITSIGHSINVYKVDSLDRR